MEWVEKLNGFAAKIHQQGAVIKPPEKPSPSELRATEVAPEVVEDKTATKKDELGGFHIVKATARSVADIKRIVMRDIQRYCDSLLDDGIRKPLCRLYSNLSQKYIGLFDQEKNEARCAIEPVDDIYGFEEQWEVTVGDCG